MVQFSAGDATGSTECITVTVLDDAISEPTETLVVRISDSTTYRINGGSTEFTETVIITVLDDDAGKYIGLLYCFGKSSENAWFHLQSMNLTLRWLLTLEVKAVLFQCVLLSLLLEEQHHKPLSSLPLI